MSRYPSKEIPHSKDVLTSLTSSLNRRKESTLPSNTTMPSRIKRTSESLVIRPSVT